MRRTVAAVIAVAVLTSAGCAREGEQDEARSHELAAESGAAVALYDNLGSYHHAITASPEAQRYFDQGLRLLYAFNHAESARSFEAGERIDPDCAMCAWGVALAKSPNINDPLDEERGLEAYAAIQRALQNAPAAREGERALIEAMAERFEPIPEADRARLDSAYAEAMAVVAERYPDDMDAQVLYADALMNLSPWNYWEADGSPRAGTEEIIGRLEYVMERDPNHPGACHLYIHAEEAHDPSVAVECAERLATLMPGAGHLVHMPGHVYIRVGRYADAIAANEHAVHADESYLEGPQVSRRGIYPQGYYPHNYHFMSFAASMAGNSETAIHAAQKVAEKVGLEVAKEIGWLEVIRPIDFWTYVTFGRWDEILAAQMPPAELEFATAAAHYARGMAFAAREEWEDAGAELVQVTQTAERYPDGNSKTALLISQQALAGEIELRKGNAAAAVMLFERAVELESSLTYNEPPTWYYPMRQSLGKALLAAGRAADAEQAYREDLDRFPANGWSLYGLYLSQEEQGKTAEADETKRQFEAAWRHADVELVASRF